MNIPADKSVCIILIGPPASGKSTVRERLVSAFASKNRSPVIISSDDMFEEYAVENSCSYSEAFSRLDFKAVEKTVKAKLGDAIDAGGDLIIDRTNLSQKTRNKVLARLGKRYHTIGVDFRVSNDILIERLKVRALTGKNISWETVSEMMKLYQEPTTEEFDEIVIID